MSEYKLYKITVEQEFVVASPAELTTEEVEKSVGNIMIIHQDSLTREGLSNVVAEEIKTEGDLPAGWETGCLPYSNYTYHRMPENIVNKPIKKFLENGTN
jgi:hypothetical protein